MSLVLADMETELKNRARIMGVFAASDSSDRLRYALRKAAYAAWQKQDWDFKNSTATITTSAGNLGPYNAPSGLVRFATTQRRALFGFCDKDTLAPIIGTDAESWDPYLRVQDGKIYFFSDPGSASLTLNYLAEVSNSIVSATLGAFLLLIPNGLNDAIVTFARGDILDDLPGKGEEAARIMARGLSMVDDYWEDVTRDRYQKTISPKGLNRIPVDGYARPITILGQMSDRFPA